jgi:acyl carrier protein
LAAIKKRWKAMKGKVALEEISQKIRNFMFENFMYGYDENEFSDDSSFLELGILDSSGILELVVFIENEFEMEVADTEIMPDNLDSVNCVSRFINNKLNNISGETI